MSGSDVILEFLDEEGFKRCRDQIEIIDLSVSKDTLDLVSQSFESTAALSLRDPKYTCFVAWLGDTVIGYAILIETINLQTKQIDTQVDHIYVAPNFRRDEVGTSLLFYAVSCLSAFRPTIVNGKMFAYAQKGANGSIPFFENFGLKPVRNMDNHVLMVHDAPTIEVIGAEEL